MIDPTKTSEYRDFVSALKIRVLLARAEAGRAINRELLMLYWDIGSSILQQQKTHGWGDNVVERIAGDLRLAFPSIRGFSTANVWRMRQLVTTYTDPGLLALLSADIPSVPAGADEMDVLAQAVRELVGSVPWGHHVSLFGKVSDQSALLFYLRSVAQYGWSRNVLLHQIKTGLYERTIIRNTSHNFDRTLPDAVARQATQMLRSRYCLEFLGIAESTRELELEELMLSRIQQFILELGYGFCFIGRQHRLVLGVKEYFIDLLFYHRLLRSLVAIELKIGEFEPEYAGKMDFYLNVLNHTERGPDDNPSIGIILCATNDAVEVEFALKTIGNPIGVAEYKIREQLPSDLNGLLPTTKQLVDVVKESLAGASYPPKEPSR